MSIGKFTESDINSVIKAVSEMNVRDSVFINNKIPLNDISSADILRLSYYQYFRKIEVCKAIAEINAINTTIMRLIIDGEIMIELETDAMLLDQSQLRQFIDNICAKYKIELDKDLSKATLYIT